MKFISWGTLLGILAGFGLFMLAVVQSTSNYIMFLSMPSFLMVIGGTFAASLISYQARYVFRTLGALAGILIPHHIGPKTLFGDVEQLIAWGREVREKGPAVLDDKLEEDTKLDQFTRYGLELLTSGYTPEQLRRLLSDFNMAGYERAMVQVGVLRSMASFAPAFGMVGTLVGLIIMLDHLGSDPGALGKGLSLALITTLFGVLAANLIFKPSALKVEQNNDIIRFRNNLLMEGFVMLASRADPLVMQDKLNSFLDPKFHFSVLDGGNGNGKKK